MQTCKSRFILLILLGFPLQVMAEYPSPTSYSTPLVSPTPTSSSLPTSSPTTTSPTQSPLYLIGAAPTFALIPITAAFAGMPLIALGAAEIGLAQDTQAALRACWDSVAEPWHKMLYFHTMLRNKYEEGNEGLLPYGITLIYDTTYATPTSQQAPAVKFLRSGRELEEGWYLDSPELTDLYVVTNWYYQERKRYGDQYALNRRHCESKYGPEFFDSLHSQ